MTPAEIIAAARREIRKCAPYYSTAVNSLSFVANNAVQTFATTAHGVCLYNEEYVAGRTKQQIAAVIVHEIHHILNNHAKRCENGCFNHAGFNIAGDMEINDDLRGVWQLPDSPFYPGTFQLEDGRTAEYYYSKLEKLAGGDNHGENPCGGAAGNPVPNEAEYDTAENGARTDVELNSVRNAVAADVLKAAQSNAGSVPAGLRVWAEVQLTPATIPWQTKLRRSVRGSLIRRAGQADYNWQRQNRRVAGLRAAGRATALAPGMDAPVPQIMVAVDTSGSMGTVERRQALSEVAGIIRATGTGTKYMSFDCEGYGIHNVRNITDVLNHTYGGGGTDFNPVFAAIAKMHVKPSTLIICTDGEGPFPATKPDGIDVIWLLCGSYNSPKPWGENISLS